MAKIKLVGCFTIKGARKARRLGRMAARKLRADNNYEEVVVEKIYGWDNLGCWYSQVEVTTGKWNTRPTSHQYYYNWKVLKKCRHILL